MNILKRGLLNVGLKENYVIKSSAPGKIILSGEHSVVYGFPALASSISLRCHATVKSTGQTKVGLDLENKGKSFHWNVEELIETFKHSPHIDPVNADFKMLYDIIQPLVPREASYDVKQACATFLTILHALWTTGLINQGFDLAVKSDIPIGRGFGSSTAFSNALIGALLVLAHKSEPIIEDMLLRLGFQCEEDMLLRLGFQCERLHHGTPSGLDNTVSILGGGIYFKDRWNYEQFAIPKISVIVVDTKVVGDTAKIVEAVRLLLNKAPRTVEPIMQSIGRISKCMVEVLRQNIGGKQMVDELSELFRANQSLLLELGTGHPRIVEAQAIGERHGVSFKISGAGAGGILIGVGELSSELHDEFEEKGFGVQTSMFDSRGLETEVLM